MLNYRIVSALVALVVSAVSIAAPPDGAELERRIDAYQSHFDEANRLSGVLLIARGDEIVLHKAYGMAHIGLGVPNSTGTRVPIASITKIMTTVVFTRLIASGVVGPDDPVSKFVPGFPEGVTLRHLAQHRAGVRHRVTSRAEESLPLTAGDIAERAARSPMLFEAGSVSVYSSAGYTTLVRCFEVASGKPYAELLSEFVFGPAAMNDSFEPLPGRDLPGTAQCYVPARGELWPAPLRGLTYLSGAGSVVSTAEDLWRFVRGLKSGAIGVPFSALARDGAVSWTGASNGCFAFVEVHPQDNLTIIWTGNSWGGCAGSLWRALPALCRGEEPGAPATRPPLVATPPVNELGAFVGSYETRAGATNDVYVLADELWFADSMLLAIGPDRFWHQPWHCEVAFVRDDSGAVIAVERVDGEARTRWPRVASGGG